MSDRKTYYYDKKLKKVVEGYPPCEEVRYGDAPYIIADTIQPYRHPAAEKWVDSRSALKALDRATGTITTDKKLPPDPSAARQREARRRADWKRCMRVAVEQIDAGTAKLDEETRALCQRQNEVVSSALGFDAFNVAGRKKNVRGKKYRK